MAKKSGSRSHSKPAPKKAPDADYHRKMASKHSATARIHSAKADLIDAQDPKKRPGPVY
jgi:hypothetical protein